MHSQGMFANLNGYSNICRLKTNKRAKRGSGGLLIFMKEEITQGIEVIGSRLKSDDRIWLKLCARFFDRKTDVYLCCLYIYMCLHKDQPTFLPEIVFGVS